MNFEKHEKNGQIYYLVPEKEMRRLQEAAENEQDIQDFDKAMDNAKEFFPQEVVDQILAGNNPLQILRKYRSITQEELAEKTMLSRAFIAQIETGKKTGSALSLKKIAAVLNVDMELLLP